MSLKGEKTQQGKEEINRGRGKSQERGGKGRAHDAHRTGCRQAGRHGDAAGATRRDGEQLRDPGQGARNRHLEAMARRTLAYLA